MATFDFSRVRLLPGFTPRRMQLPTMGVTVDQHGRRSFELSTAQGPIKVELGWGWDCRGTKEALIDYGLILEDWLPGTPGNNTTTQIVLFMPDGQVALGSWKGGRPPGYPSLRITRHSGRTFTVTIPYTEAEEVEFENFRAAWKEQRVQEESARAAEDAWNKAKKAHDPDTAFVERWRNSVIAKLQELARLIEGSLVFTGFPEFRMTGGELDETQEAIAKVEKLIVGSKPTIPVIKVRENVIGLDGRAYRHMQ